MKTITTYLITLMLTLAFLSAGANTGPWFDDEGYINDIPFDTEMIVHDYITQFLDYSFEDEPFIDDMPFNTEGIAAGCKYKKALSVIFNLEDEPDIEDIPFDTRVISEKSRYQTAIEQVFYFEDEKDIHDMPFDIRLTETINPEK